MASPQQPTRRPPPQVQTFKARESLIRFTKFLPLIIVGVIVMVAGAAALGWYLNNWLIPLFMAFPLFQTGVSAVVATRMSKASVMIDGGGFRILDGETLKAQVPWNHITRLTVRQERGDNVYEVWVKNRVVPLGAAVLENGDQLLAAVSARTNRPWERQAAPR